MSPELAIREPQSAADLVALHLLRLLQGDEMAPAPVNPEKVMAELIDAVRDPDRHIMLLAVREDRLVGYLLIEKLNYRCSDQFFLGDFGLYVLPAHRNAGVAGALLREGREIARLAGLDLYITRPARNRAGSWMTTRIHSARTPGRHQGVFRWAASTAATRKSARKLRRCRPGSMMPASRTRTFCKACRTQATRSTKARASRTSRATRTAPMG